MTQRDNILQELHELNSTLANSNPENVFSVPAGYFEGLAAQLLTRIKAMEAANATDELAYLSPVLSGLSREMLFTVPAGYFDGLEKKMMQSIRENSDYTTAKEEIEMLSPLLSGLKKEMPYEVPQGYFERLAPGITATTGKQEAKVISITQRKWFRYAAAAVVTGVIMLAGFLYFNRGKQEPGSKAIAKVTHDIKKMSDTQKDKLIDFIDAGLNGKETAQVNTDNKSKEVRALLQGVPDAELKDFQEQTEDIADIMMTN